MATDNSLVPYNPNPGPEDDSLSIQNRAALSKGGSLTSPFTNDRSLYNYNPGRPVPSILHVAEAEREAQHKRAIEHVMLRDKLTHPEAEKRVLSEGAGSILARIDTGSRMSDASAMLALRRRLSQPGGTIDYLMNVEMRLGALEGLTPRMVRAGPYTKLPTQAHLASIAARLQGQPAPVGQPQPSAYSGTQTNTPPRIVSPARIDGQVSTGNLGRGTGWQKK